MPTNEKRIFIPERVAPEPKSISTAQKTVRVFALEMIEKNPKFNESFLQFIPNKWLDCYVTEPLSRDFDDKMEKIIRKKEAEIMDRPDSSEVMDFLKKLTNKIYHS